MEISCGFSVPNIVISFSPHHIAFYRSRRGVNENEWAIISPPSQVTSIQQYVPRVREGPIMCYGHTFIKIR